MISPFPYDLTVVRERHQGELYYVTGSYAGGNVETTTTTTTRNNQTSTKTVQHETINLRAANGKVYKVVKDGTADIPYDSQVSFLYVDGNNDKYWPVGVMIHDNDKCYTLGKKEDKRLARAITKYGVVRRLWGLLIDLFFAVAALALSGAVAFLVGQMVGDDWGTIAAIVAFIAALIGCAPLFTWPMGLLKSRTRHYDEAQQKGFNAFYEFCRKLPRHQSGDGGISQGNAKSIAASESEEFQPMF